MSWKDILSDEAKDLIIDIDKSKTPIENWFDKIGWVLNYKLREPEITFLKDKGKKERRFIKRYSETELALIDSNITISAYIIALVALIVSGIALIISNPLLINVLPKNDLNTIYSATFGLAFYLMLIPIIIYCIIHLYINPKFNRYKAIIMAIEDVELKNQQAEPLDTIKVAIKDGAVDMESPKNKMSFMQRMKHFMLKLQMFDISNKEMRERKLKFIEILLIVGGIVGGTRISNQSIIMNIVFGFFILGSILYYITVSNKLDSKIIRFEMYISMSFIAIGFSAISISPFTYKGISIFNTIIIAALGISLVFLIFLALYGSAEETTE